jgi:CDP-diacylglycerol--glycerol-3-phosphate 3-phosphatidyltransferase
MISIYNIKPKFQELLKPILELLHRKNITANQITVSSIFLSFLIGLSFWFADKNIFLYLTLPIGLFIRMALNALDGMMARTYNQQTKKGEILNELGDVVSDLFIFFPLIKHEPSSLYLVLIFICLSIINEFAGVLGKIISGERRYEGPMGKSDRAFFIGLYGILSFFGMQLGNLSVYVLSGVIILLLISTSTRILKSLK